MVGVAVPTVLFAGMRRSPFENWVGFPGLSVMIPATPSGSAASGAGWSC